MFFLFLFLFVININSIIINSIQNIYLDTNDIFWFIQISDFQVSYNFNKEDELNLKRFLNESIPIINPLFVLATGNLVENTYNETQWILYQSILKEYNYYKPEFWMDIRGIHDIFSSDYYIPDMYSQYSVSGYYNKSSVFDFNVKTKTNKYSFIGYNSITDYIPVSSTYSWGSIDKKRYDELTKIMNNDSNLTILFTYHPLSYIYPISSSNRSLNFFDLFESKNISIMISNDIYKRNKNYVYKILLDK